MGSRYSRNKCHCWHGDIWGTSHGLILIMLKHEDFDYQLFPAGLHRQHVSIQDDTEAESSHIYGTEREKQNAIHTEELGISSFPIFSECLILTCHVH